MPVTVPLVNIIDPEEHQIVETPESRFLAEALQTDRFFTYHAKKAKTWVVAVWVNKERGRFADLETMMSLEQMDRQVVENLRKFHENKTPSCMDLNKQLTEEEIAFCKREEEGDFEHMEHKKAMQMEVRKRFGNVKSEAPYYTKPGMTGIIAPADPNAPTRI